MNIIRIVGGPSPQSIKVLDVTSGMDITSRVVSIKLHTDTRQAGGRTLLTAELTVWAEVDVKVEDPKIETARRQPPPQKG